MNTTKLIFASLSLLVFFSALKVQYSNQLRLYEKFVFLILTVSSLIIITNPVLLDIVAGSLKVERGTDLLFYIYMLLSCWGLIRSHIRINTLSSSINKLTSQIAIDSPIVIDDKKEK